MCLSSGRRQRHRCKSCGRRFCSTTRTLLHYLKKKDPALNAKIFHSCVRGVSNRSIGRDQYVSEHCVRGRLKRLARQALSFQSQSCKGLKIGETLCFDGLENFAGTQYDPNNIQQAVGRDSLFIYDFNFCGLNRKGRTSPWQKRRLAEIEADKGRYNPQNVRVATRHILRRLYEKRNGDRLDLASDRHFHYRQAVQEDLARCHIDHATISSKACRNFQNILFPVNHADLLIRDRLGAFSRETISFSKTPGAMCQKYALFMVHKNYMVPQFTKKHVRRPDAHKKSPAEKVGLCHRLLHFDDIFFERSSFEETKKHLNVDWRYFWNGRVPPRYLRQLKFRKTTDLTGSPNL